MLMGLTIFTKGNGLISKLKQNENVIVCVKPKLECPAGDNITLC